MPVLIKTSRDLLRSALAAAAVVVVTSQAQAGRPNVLFIAVDDLRPELGAYGANHVKSPNIDRIAREGMIFNHAYCQQAVCSPSRTSLLTGTRPDTNKVWNMATRFRSTLPDVVTLPQHFKNNGYFVQGMGKIFHTGLNDPQSWSVPFQEHLRTIYAKPESIALKQREEKRAKAGSKGKKRSPRGPAFEAGDVPDDFYPDGKTAALTLKALREIARDPKPFFLAVGFMKPHLPFVAPKKYWDLYDPQKIELAPNKFRPRGAPEYAIEFGGELRLYPGIPAGSIPDDLARQLKHGYYASISYSDALIGKLLDELDRLGLRENTIVVVWGDHGWKLGEHDAWCKQSNCENDTHAPLIVSVPGMKHAGARTDALVEFVDIYPTLAELAGLPLPSHLEGISFKPVLGDPRCAWKKAAFSQFPRKRAGRLLMGYTLRTDEHRFTVWVDRADHTRVDAIELYDHRSDPQENTNIARVPANAALVEQLMRQWRAGWRGALPHVAQ